MGNIFKVKLNRKIFVANQNCFQIPIKHPSRTLNEHIISYVVKGSWKLQIGAETVNVKNDNVFIQPANVPHTGIELCSPGTNTMFIHFSFEEGDEYTESGNADIPSDCLFISNFIDASNNPEIKRILIKIIEEKTKGNDTKASIYLNLLLCELSESLYYDKSKYTYAVNIKKIINNNITKNLSNKEIAGMLDTSVRTAETTFKECFNMTIHQYQLHQKIEQAKFCLEYYPAMKIIEIAQNLGFFDEYHFSRQFKKAVGASPTEYRKETIRLKNIP